ncbi:MAG: hypothetical protein HWN67_08095 [Candidatus Helarchaeota archaeon]|nr:hypothetical protein [Candidatus Helarchaeota archaeon]
MKFEGTAVTITINVTDDKQIDKVFLLYSIDNLTTWNLIQMSSIGGNNYSASIPGQKGGTIVYYQIYAFDNESFMKINDNDGSYYNFTFQKSPKKPSMGIIPLGEPSPLNIVTLLIIILGAVGGAVVGFFVLYKKEKLPFKKRTKKLKSPYRTVKRVAKPKLTAVESKALLDEKTPDIDKKLQELQNELDKQQFKLERYKLLKERGTISDETFLDFKKQIIKKIDELRNQIKELENKNHEVY